MCAYLTLVVTIWYSKRARGGCFGDIFYHPWRTFTGGYGRLVGGLDGVKVLDSLEDQNEQN